MCYVKEVFLEILQNPQDSICARVSFLIELQAQTCKFIKKEILTQLFSCEFCEIFKNTFFLQNTSSGCFFRKVLCYTIPLIISGKHRNSCPDVFCKKGVLKDFAKFTGKNLCWCFFFEKGILPTRMFS